MSGFVVSGLVASSGVVPGPVWIVWTIPRIEWVIVTIVGSAPTPIVVIVGVAISIVGVSVAIVWIAIVVSVVWESVAVVDI